MKKKIGIIVFFLLLSSCGIEKEKLPESQQTNVGTGEIINETLSENSQTGSFLKSENATQTGTKSDQESSQQTNTSTGKITGQSSSSNSGSDFSQKNEKQTQLKTVTSSKNYSVNDYEGNYVWGGAMNLAWNELNENILHEKSKLNTKEEKTLKMVSRLNNASFSKSDLDAESYYIKSGYGQETVNIINTEVKIKFPEKSFGNLLLSLEPKDIITYAYFFKKIEYKTKFSTDPNFSFSGEKVKGFKAKQADQKVNVEIVNYENDDKFIIKIKLKQESDEVIFAKGYNMGNPQQIINKINVNSGKDLPTIADIDKFSAPYLHLDYTANYDEITGKYFANKGFENYKIEAMVEKIKFDIDEVGVKVENEAYIHKRSMMAIPSGEPPKVKNFILDKPFWVMMKRTDSRNPYFILAVNNTKLMEKVE